MIKAIYTETHNSIALRNSDVPVTLELLRTPRGYAVHIYKDKDPVQNLPYADAIAMYRVLSNALWGFSVDPLPKMEDL